MTGSVTDYETGDPLAGATVATEGLATPLTATTDDLGNYTFPEVPTDQVFSIMVTAPGAYLVTHNPRVLSTGVPQTVNLHAVGLGTVQRSHAAAAPTPLDFDPLASYVIAHLVKGDGTPRDGVALADVLLQDIAVPPAPAGLGTFFIALDGLIDPNILTSLPGRNGMASVGFLNVPAQTLTINATYPLENDGGNGGGDPLKVLSIATIANHVHIVTVNNKPVEDFLAGASGGGGGGGDGSGGGDGTGGGGGGGGN
jgi:uncharacterized membrane protein YgcG